MVVKASAGVAFHAPVLRCPAPADAATMLRESGYPLFALAADARQSLFEATLPKRAAFVLGSETAGVSPEVAQAVTDRVSIPMSGGVESLNVASAAAVLCFDLMRRGLTT
jgi:23S rRNA (guanosine2251-2'-O)-methyltransferase